MPDRTAPPAFAAQARETANALYRSDSRRVFATLVRLLGDFDVAEEALHDAFAAALEQWPQDGIPANPRAWLVSAGRFKAIDAIRRRARMQPLPDDYEERFAAETGDPSQIESEELEDDRLRLIFTCCHPALAVEAQIALTLREVCGLATEEIARAFLAPTATLAQRVVRAKAKIRNAGIPYQVPARRELADRLEAVLRVVYLVFNEGCSASAGASLTRHDLSAEAIRLGRLLAQLQPEPETLGLLGLMLLHESRRAARTAPNGDIILLDQQDRSIWDRALIVEGSALAQRALATDRVGTYALQAAIAAVHANAQKPEDTDWSRIAALYDLLIRAEPSPVVELNRAVAVGMRDGAEAGLDLIDALFARGELANYRLAHATRADFCRRLGRTHEARAAYMRALELTDQEPERRFLERRLLELTS